MNREDYTPLVDAIKGGDLAAVESFLQTPDVDVDFIVETVAYDRHIDTYRYTPLSWAIRWNQKSIVELLVDHGAAVNGVDGADETPLQLVCYLGKQNEEIVKVLLEHGADVDGITARERLTPLALACWSDSNLGFAQFLLNAGADVNGGYGYKAPLHEAAYYGEHGVTQLLIEAGADVNIQSTEESYLAAGSTPLHFAARNCKTVSVTTLLAAGADPNIANAEGQNPLHRAMWLPSIDVINALLAAGCDPLHRENDERQTPLQYLDAVVDVDFSAEQFKIITALVAAGDRSWECVPTPCPGLEAAMLSVWQNAPDDLPELVKRMENPPQSLIELYARIHDEEMKKVVQEVLRVLHRHFAGFPHLKEHLLNSIFGFTTSV